MGGLLPNQHATIVAELNPPGISVLARPHLHLFSETRNANGSWIADAAPTFSTQESPVTGRLVSKMEENPCPRVLPLYGLLSDEVWESLPWSCWQKGLPEDASPQVLALSQEWGDDSFGHNHLTLQELAEKYAEILSDPREQAQELRKPLADMLYLLTVGTPDEISPKDRRVVFWFN